MQRFTLITVACFLGCTASAFGQSEPAGGANDINAQASALEAELARYKDASPEAADLMVQLVDLYHAHSRVFGLVRIADRFVAAHTGDARHPAVMLKLMDGLEATSRNKEVTAAARQFLARYPDAKEAADVEVRLARTLEELPDRVAAADACRLVWKRQPGTPTGIEHGLRAITHYSSINNSKVFVQAAELAEEMFSRLPAGGMASHIGMRAVYEWRRAGEFAKSNQVANAMLQKKLPAEPQRQRELHTYMAENYTSQSQHANAAKSFIAARSIEDSPAHHLRSISHLFHAGTEPPELAKLVNAYGSKYPERDDRHQARSILAQAYLRAGDKPQALRILAELLPVDAVSNDNVGVYVRENGKEPPQLQQSAQVLRKAIAANPAHAARLRYVLALNIYRDGLKDEAQTRQVLRELISQSPTNDNYSWYAVNWLLSNPPEEKVFRDDLELILKTRREYLNLADFRGFPARWIKDAKKNKEWRERAELAETKLREANADPVTSLWLEAVDGRQAEAARKQLLKPDVFKSLADRLAYEVLRAQAHYVWRYGGSKRRPEAAEYFAQMCQRFPKDFQAAVWYLQTATDYSPPEVAREAALHLLKFPYQPQAASTDIWRRLMLAADRAKDTDLAKQAFAWIQACEEKSGLLPASAYYIGDVLARLELEDDAVKYWQKYIPVDRNHVDSNYCAQRVASRLEGDAKAKFLAELLSHDSDYHGQYASLLAQHQLDAGDIDGFEKTLAAALERQNARPFRNWTADLGLALGWVNKYRTDENLSAEDKQRVFRAVSQFKLGRASAAALLALDELQATDAPPSLAKLLEIQSTTRMVGNEYYDFDQLLPYAQSAMGEKRFLKGAVLLTGMLANITNAREDRQQTGRDLVAQCYSRMGNVGLTIDEKSPLAPLLKAALYLRLGDNELAWETYLGQQALFTEHRSEVPFDLLMFVCRRRIAEGGDQNANFVEDTLRSWQIANSESKHIEDSTKADVQLLLARNFFQSQRYDVARAEFTTVVNRFASTPQAVEAEFGIGETFMAQKVYDQAEAVFEKLASSRDADIVVRAEFLRGVLAFRRGERDAARDIFRNVLERVPSVELANQALFNLAEVYGDEERYIEQLNLLRTVGRLGRESKRWHAPGTPLSIVVQDSDLGISRGNSKIPVRVTTEPGGDSELIYLVSGGAGKGLFRADLETQLGRVTKDDGVLQLTGEDAIRCDYPENFKSEFKHVALSNIDIRVAADAQFEITSSRRFEEEEESFSSRLQREADRDDGDVRVSEQRPSNQVKPGNPIYLRVIDPDRDLTDAPDQTVVKLQSDSGDEVQVTLTETDAHTGRFEGHAETAELPAGALASDTAIEHSPLMAIDKDPESYWLSVPDGATPKSLTVDMQDVHVVSRVQTQSPEADRQSPVRGTLLGSNDGVFWFRLAGNPKRQPVPAVEETFGPMRQRVYAGRHTDFDEWNDVVGLVKNEQPFAEALVAEFNREMGDSDEDADQPYSVVWHGRLVQEQDGTARISVRGTRTALYLDGQLELPLGPGGRSADIWLRKGTHNLTIFAATTAAARGVSATWAKANQSGADVTLVPFTAADFDLDQPAANIDAAASATPKQEPVAEGEPQPEPLPRVTVEDNIWQFEFEPVPLRYARFVIDEYVGEAVAINNIRVTGPEEGQVYIPTETDVLSLASNNVLEIAAGDSVTATYTDRFTQSESGQSRLLTADLTATYFNAELNAIAYDFVKRTDGAVETVRKQLMRIDPGERLVVEIVDYDMDQTDQPDSVEFEVVVNDQSPLVLTATETDTNTGLFTKEVDTALQGGPDVIAVRPGDRIYCRYVDRQNTFPGHAVSRETVVYVNSPSEGQVRVLQTRVIRGEGENDARRPQQVLYDLPDAQAETVGVAFEAPLTIEVIDPDAAKDDRSSVVVSLKTTEGVTVDVECVVSDAFVPQRQSALGNWALAEGRFVGQVVLQLGGRNSPHVMPSTTQVTRNLIGSPLEPEGADTQSAFDRSLVTRVLNLTGKDIVTATYRDQLRPDAKPRPLSAQARLLTDGTLACLDREYEQEVEGLRVGERIYLQVTDADRDTTAERDTALVTIETERGEKETVALQETLAHSGVFTGSLRLKPNKQPTPGNLDASEPEIESDFGDRITFKYADEFAATESGRLESLRELPVVVGTDGLVSAFSKTFEDEQLAVETKFHIAESYFELFKSHNNLSRDVEAKTDLQAGRRVLREVMEDYPDPKYVPRVSYLLGQFAQELEQWNEAIDAYAMIVRQFPEHTLAADAQYKLAQCHEEAGQFDEALEAYVTLAATYPQSPLIANVMIRISDHFYKNERYDVAGQVGEKFLEKFATHQYASRIAFRVGQCHYKSEQYTAAGDAFDQFVKQFPDDPLCSDALFWSGESFRQGRNNRFAFQRYNRCRWDFPESDAAKYARGRLALPEMLAQFEAEANSIDDD